MRFIIKQKRYPNGYHKIHTENDPTNKVAENTSVCKYQRFCRLCRGFSYSNEIMWYVKYTTIFFVFQSFQPIIFDFLP